MKIAIEGCAHGELEMIYETIAGIEKEQNMKIDLLLCCGDFQSSRNLEDLQTMAVPKKYQAIGSFYKYYSGERVAPMLTIFIGGNHEASNYLQELPYGGWVAPNIFYLGYAGVVRVNGIRIAGISGIYKGQDFLKGRFEFSPYNQSTCRSVYHVRQLEVFRLKQLSDNIDIFMSHDWPRGIYNYGNKAQLVNFKPHFQDEIDNDQLGSRPCEDLLKALKPSMWFAAHLHCKFAALVPHEDDSFAENAETSGNTKSYGYKKQENKFTKFLALDKCLPKRRFLQVLDIDSVEDTDDGDIRFEYDIEWLSILYHTNHLINVGNAIHYMPGPGAGNLEQRYNFTPTAEELQLVRQKFSGDFVIPKNFCRTVQPYVPGECTDRFPEQPKAQINPQSLQFCDTLGIDDPLSVCMLVSGHELSHSSTLDSSNSDTQLNDSSILLAEQSNLSSSNCLETSPTNIKLLKRKSNSSLDLPKPTATSPISALSSNEQSIDSSMNTDELSLYASSGEVANSSTTETKGVLLTASPPDGANPLNEKFDLILSSKKFKRRNQSVYQDDEHVV